MAEYEIFYYPKAENDLDSLEPNEALKVAGEIEKFLSLSPFPYKKRKKKIQGVMYPLYRLRVDTKNDSYRIFYMIEKKKVVILRIVTKKDAERTIRNLKKYR
ncbi:MAG: type II toxin-antitoxin system RelE/ParE family toxin [bacterium]|nr:type II toxin-antitoxin system RelE/ParE family toxin [bacterium]